MIAKKYEECIYIYLRKKELPPNEGILKPGR